MESKEQPNKGSLGNKRNSLIGRISSALKNLTKTKPIQYELDMIKQWDEFSNLHNTEKEFVLNWLERKGVVGKKNNL